MSTEIDRRLRINVKRLLEFFDEKPIDSQGHATSIVAIAGEDLGVGLLKHYLECTRNAKVTILPGPVGTGKKKGPRLDRWVDVVWPDGSGRLFQTEIKNWSAHAIGGKILKVDAPPDEVARFGIQRWEMYAGAMYTWKAINKVLTPMKKPPDVDPSHTLEPLLIYWWVIHPKGLSESFFSHDLETSTGFSRLWLFSMSSYLRGLNEDAIELEMPHTAKRMSWLHELFLAQ